MGEKDLKGNEKSFHKHIKKKKKRKILPGEKKAKNDTKPVKRFNIFSLIKSIVL